MTKKEWTIIGVLGATVVVVLVCLGGVMLTMLPNTSLPQVSMPVFPTSPPPTKVSCERVVERDFLKAPETYRGRCVMFFAKISNIEESGNKTFMQINIRSISNTLLPDAVAANCNGTFPGYYKGEEVIIVGIGAGTIQGKNAFGVTISQPLITDCYMESAIR